MLVLGSALLCSCSRESASKVSATPKGADRRPVPVLVATVVSKIVPLEIVTFGTVEAAATVDVRAEVTGTLKTVHFAKGQDVKAGDLLFTLDARPFEVDLEQAKANLARDQIKAKNSRTEAARTAALLKTGIATPSEAEKIDADTAALDAVVQADDAAIRNAALQVERCTIRSPVDGRVGNLLIDRGNLVKANDMILVTINQVRPIEVAFSVPQKELPGIRTAMAQGKLPLIAILPGDEAVTETGVLTFVDNAIDRGTGMIQLRGTFANSAERLWPGLYVNAKLVLASRPELVVPARAVQTGRNNKYVFILKADVSVDVRTVLVRRLGDEEMVVVSGLAEGDQVVTDGQMRLNSGSLVEVRKSLNGTENGNGPAAAEQGAKTERRAGKGKEAGR